MLHGTSQKYKISPEKHFGVQRHGLKRIACLFQTPPSPVYFIMTIVEEKERQDRPVLSTFIYIKKFRFCHPKNSPLLFYCHQRATTTFENELFVSVGRERGDEERIM